MSKTLMLALTLLCSTAWLLAQGQYSQSPQTSSEAGQASAAGQTSGAGQTSIEGCLQGSNGNFTLTDSSGTAYQLQGDDATLTKHVGHEVKVTGTASAAAAAPAPGSAGTNNDMSKGSAQALTFTVDKLKHISATCKAASK